MRLMLAPMQGVLDYTLRDILTSIGGYDRCVTEFVRVTTQAVPKHVFYRYCPELREGGTTPAGTPVYVQLLGSHPQWMAHNAAVAARLGAWGIDINFGCPAKIVNNNQGGSVLLQEPQRVHNIVREVRQAVDAAVPVTAKIRLGFHDSSLLPEIVAGIVEAGATELCIHARTRQQGYRPPAYWAEIGAIRPQTPIPVIANGEIWSAADAQAAQTQSGCSDLMLGRGALSYPDLALQIRAGLSGQAYTPLSWEESLHLLHRYADRLQGQAPISAAGFIKQWANYLRRQSPPAEAFFQHIKCMKQPSEMMACMLPNS